MDDFPRSEDAGTASDPYHHSAEDERIFSMGIPLAHRLFSLNPAYPPPFNAQRGVK